jgi:hypothetical protein
VRLNFELKRQILGQDDSRFVYIFDSVSIISSWMWTVNGRSGDFWFEFPCGFERSDRQWRHPFIVDILAGFFLITRDVPCVRSCECEWIHEDVIPFLFFIWPVMSTHMMTSHSVVHYFTPTQGRIKYQILILQIRAKFVSFFSSHNGRNLALGIKEASINDSSSSLFSF